MILRRKFTRYFYAIQMIKKLLIFIFTILTFQMNAQDIIGDWYLYFMRFNPDHFLKKVKCPVWAVNGELDLQVTSKENLAGIRKSLKQAKNKNYLIASKEGCCFFENAVTWKRRWLF